LGLSGVQQNRLIREVFCKLWANIAHLGDAVMRKSAMNPST
jgi:hypothetical protein